MSLLYHIVKYTCRIGFPLYFGKIEINGQQHIPKHNPFILAPNHQNAFMDAVLAAVFIDKPLHFLTRSDVFVPPYDRILRSLNMMPVYRIRDGYEKLKKNKETFDHCDKVLSKGEVVLVFPEGNMGPGHALRPLTKGTSRMAFQAQASLDQELLIVPLGINYFHHNHPRHKLILNFGQPIKVNDYQELHKSHQAKGLIALRNSLSEALEGLLLVPKVDENYNQKLNIRNRQYEHFSFRELKEVLKQPDSISKETYHPQLKVWSTFFSIPNCVPLFLIYKILKRIKDEQFIGSIKFIVGLFSFPLWWLLLGIISLALFNFLIALGIVTSSVASLFIRESLMKRIR